MLNGWIKIHRSLLEWEWWDDANMVRAYMYILLAANTTPYRWHGMEFEAGTFVTSLMRMACSMGLSLHQTRLVLERMVRTGEIALETTNKYTVVHVCNWDKYQQENGTQMACERQTDGKQMATDKEIKNTRNNNTPCVRVQEQQLPVELQAEKQTQQTCFDFAAFWETYGKKVDKEKCVKKYAKIPEKERATIAQVLPVYIASTPDVTYRKNPLTWLNGQCWRDEMQAQPESRQQARQQQPSTQVLHCYTFAADEQGSGKQDWEA